MSIIIGIDPDVDKNGYAVWFTIDKKLELYNYSFWEVIDDFESWNVPIKVIIEAGWLINKSNWHNEKLGSRISSRIGTKVGANHQVGKLLYEYCLKNNIEAILIKPKGKVKSDYFKKVTGYTKKTNQEQRDAAMLVYGL